MERKTPQEKKRLSYQRDRRNTYGENDKSSRKNIPRAKRHPNRVNRRVARQSLSAAVGDAGASSLEQMDAELKHRRPKRWRKRADSPLALVVPRKLKRRVETGIISADEAEEKEARIRRRLARTGPDGGR
jgi:hypothetical protein